MLAIIGFLILVLIGLWFAKMAILTAYGGILFVGLTWEVVATAAFLGAISVGSFWLAFANSPFKLTISA